MGLKELADIKRIEIHLDKYWQGETSREEETVLKAYFNGKKVAGHLKYVQPLFVVLQQEKEKKLPGNFNDNLRQKLTETSRNWVVPIKISTSLTKKLLKIAATLLLILMAAYIFQSQFTNSESDKRRAQLGTFEDPEKAYEQVKNSLQLVSAKLNKGNIYIEELSKFNKGATLFNQQKTQKTQNE